MQYRSPLPQLDVTDLPIQGPPLPDLWDPSSTQNRTGLDRSQRLYQSNPTYRSLMDRYRTITQELATSYESPGWDDQEAQRRAQALMNQGRYDDISQTQIPGPGIDPRSDRQSATGGMPFNWTTAYSFSLDQIHKERDERQKTATEIANQMREVAQQAGELTGPNDVLPLTTQIPDRRPGAQPGAMRDIIWSAIDGKGSIHNIPDTVLKFQLGVTPDREEQSRSAQRVAEINAASAANTARVNQLNQESRERIQNAANEWRWWDTAVKFRQSINETAVRNRDIDAKMAHDDLEVIVKKAESAEQRFRDSIHEAGVYDTNQIAGIAMENKWNQETWQTAISVIETENKNRSAEDVAAYNGLVSQQNTRIEVAQNLALQATQAFRESLKNVTPVRADMLQTFQRGLVALSLGHRLPEGFAQATDFPVAQMTQQVGENAMRRFLGTEGQPDILPPIIRYERGERLPYPEQPAMIPRPQGIVTPELIGTLAQPNPMWDQIPTSQELVNRNRENETGPDAELRNYLETGLRSGYGDPTVMTPPRRPDYSSPSVQEPLPADVAPNPIETPPIQQEEAPPADEAFSLPDSFGGMGAGRFGVNAVGGDYSWLGGGGAEPTYGSPLPTDQDPGQSPIVQLMDNIPFNDPRDIAGAGVAVAATWGGDDPETAFKHGFPDDDWYLSGNGLDDYTSFGGYDYAA